MKRAELAALLLAVVVLGPSRAAAGESCGPVVLSEVAAESGILFHHRRGATAAKHLPETMGSGLAWLDFDGDGWLDLYAVQSGGFPPDGGAKAANGLFRNLGNGRFVEIPAAAGAADRGYGQGVLAADLDGDGDTDLYVANYGPDALYLNDGRGHFADGTTAAGLDTRGWSSSAAAADADADGDLELYVARYVEYDPGDDIFCGDPSTGRRRYCDPSIFRGARDILYRNLGEGRFKNASSEAGIAPADGRGLAVVSLDLDGDLDPDLYVANDLTVNFLFRNRGDGTFEDLSLPSGTAVNREGKPEAGMGIAAGDVDGDLDPELVVTNFDVETNTLYRNHGAGVFEDASAASGFGTPSFNLLAFGIVLADLDIDGHLDAYIANGHIFEEPWRENVRYAQRDQILLGDGQGRFSELRCPLLESEPLVSRGLAWADYDSDGDPDLAVQASDGPLRLLRNGAGRGSWLGLRLEGEPENTEGVGARVLLTTHSSSRVRWVLAGDSYQSSSDRRTVFRVPDGDSARSVEIVWRRGKRLRVVAPPVDRYLVLYESPPERVATAAEQLPRGR